MVCFGIFYPHSYKVVLIFFIGGNFRGSGVGLSHVTGKGKQIIEGAINIDLRK
jgi:hypothetical protein